MSRPRKSSNVLQLKGAFRKNPQRRRTPPKVTHDLPLKPPVHLTAEQKKTWAKIIKLIPDGVVTFSDTILIEMTAVLLTAFRKNGLKMKASHISRLSICYERLGLTPTGRASLGVGNKTSGDDFE